MERNEEGKVETGEVTWGQRGQGLVGTIRTSGFTPTDWISLEGWRREVLWLFLKCKSPSRPAVFYVIGQGQKHRGQVEGSCKNPGKR